MDGVKLREVSMYDIVNDRRSYRWDVMVGKEQRMFAIEDVRPGELEKARQLAREALKDATAEVPDWQHKPYLQMTYI